jgi:ribonuclease R
MNDYEKLLLDTITAEGYQAITLKAIVKRLHVDSDDYPQVRAAAKVLIRTGRIELGRNKTLKKLETKGALVGTFRRTSKGFGFVRTSKDSERSKDIYIAADDSLDASTGDTVTVKITKRPHSPGMNVQGRIIQVVERASGLFVGTYFEDGGAGYVKIDGTTFQAPLYVGDPGAKGAKPNDKVAVEIARYPTPDVEGEGVITEILGERGQPGVDTLTVIRAHGIPDTFDDETLDEARWQARHFSETEIGGRLDLRGELIVTIDPASARDFDDAISLTRDEKTGFWTLGVHIADVSHFVRPNTALDRTARKRGTSVYLPDRVIPMLPEVISNSLASLQAGHPRYTMSVFMEFDSNGIRTDARFTRSVIHVKQRFSYEQAYALMMNPVVVDESVAPETRAMLSRMLELAMVLRKRRFARGALELNMPEVQVELGDKGEVTGAHLTSDDESHQVIEEFMLAANEAVAGYLNERHVGFLRRGHADPDPIKLKKFADFARSLGFTIDSPQSRFELQRVLKEAADRPERHAVHFGLLRSLKQANYTPEHEGHYALASDDYCHFTSPIRRYPDLQVHRQLGAILDGKTPRNDPEELVALAEHCTRTERRAEAAEREIIKIKLLTHLESKIGSEFHAVIVGVEDFGVFAQLVEFPVEGLVHVTSLSDDYYYLEDATHTLIGRRSGRKFRLGDRIAVRVARVDLDRRELDLVLIGGEGQGDTPAEPRPGPSRHQRRAKEKRDSKASPSKAPPPTGGRRTAKERKAARKKRR